MQPPPLLLQFSPLTQAFLNRLAIQPTAQRAQLYDNLIDELNGAGLFAKLDVLHIFAADNEQTALTNVVQANYRATNGGAVFTQDQGYNGDGISHFVSADFNPTTATSPQFTQDSACVFAWSLSSAQDQGGIWGGQAGNDFMYPRHGAPTSPNNSFSFSLNDNSGSGDTNNPFSDASGLWMVSRDAAGVRCNRNLTHGVQAYTHASSGIANNDFVYLTDNSGNFWSGRLGLAGIGSKMNNSDCDNLYSALHPYMQAVAGVP